MVLPGKVYTNTRLHWQGYTQGSYNEGCTGTCWDWNLYTSTILIDFKFSERCLYLPSGKSWTLGNYTAEFGGPQARGKCTFGIFVPFTKRDEENDTDDDCEVYS